MENTKYRYVAHKWVENKSVLVLTLSNVLDFNEHVPLPPHSLISIRLTKPEYDDIFKYYLSAQNSFLLSNLEYGLYKDGNTYKILYVEDSENSSTSYTITHVYRSPNLSSNDFILELKEFGNKREFSITLGQNEIKKFLAAYNYSISDFLRDFKAFRIVLGENSLLHKYFIRVEFMGVEVATNIRTCQEIQNDLKTIISQIDNIKNGLVVNDFNKGDQSIEMVKNRVYTLKKLVEGI